MTHALVTRKAVGSTELPPSAVTLTTANAFKGTGAVSPNLAEGNDFLIEALGGNVEIKPPTGTPPRSRYGVLLELVQDAVGERNFTFAGMEVAGLTPPINKAAKAITWVELFTNNGGASWFVLGPVEGPEGKEGKEPFLASKYELPTGLSVYKETGAATTEARAILFENVARDMAISNLTLTSGQSVGALVTVPAHTVCTGPAIGIATAEAKPTNRTHLWMARLDLVGKVVAVTGDYTSSVNTPMGSGTARGLKWTEAMAEVAEVKQYIDLILNAVSAEAALTLLAVNGAAALMNLVPKKCVLGPAAMTVPPTIGETLALAETSKRFWVGGH